MLYGITNLPKIVFAAAMSMKRFQFISRFIEFDVKKTCEERWKPDKFACMRYIFDEVNCKFVKGQNQSLFLVIDETLYPYRGHKSFKQYNPSKPARMDFCTAPYVMLVSHAFITAYHTLGSLTQLMAKPISIMLRELTITQNIW